MIVHNKITWQYFHTLSNLNSLFRNETNNENVISQL